MPSTRIYCADCSERSCEAVRYAVGRESDMLWLGSATDGSRAFEEICRLAPDVVVMTLVLPGMDGFALLERVCAMPSAPAVIVTSHMTRECCIEECIRLGATYYLIKPVPTDLLIRRIRDIRRLQRRFFSGDVPSVPAPARGGEIVGGVLRDIGVSSSLKGYSYLIDAALAALSQQRVSVSHDLYPEIGRKYNVSADSVERAIRHAILSTWARPATLRRYNMFGDDRPSNRAMILRLAREVEPMLRAAEQSR